MDRSNVIKLIKEEFTSDEIRFEEAIGQDIVTEIPREVYCDIQSVSGTEWFNGSKNGMNPQYKVTMFKYDYEGELIAEYNNVRYSVYRTYETRDDIIEIYLEKKAGV